MLNNLEFSFKIAIFDLDQTLWNGKKLFSSVHSILSMFRSHNIKLYIASFNLIAPKYCERLGIDHYFSDIKYGQDRSKSAMIREILTNHPDVKSSDVIFFDDNGQNIADVIISTDVAAVHVDWFTGITWNVIPMKYL